MPIGNEQNLTLGQINTQLASLAQRWQALAEDTLAYAATITEMGTAGLEAAPIGASTQDATDIVAATDYMLTNGQVYMGLAAQTPAFNFSNTAVLIRARGLIMS